MVVTAVFIGCETSILGGDMQHDKNMVQYHASNAWLHLNELNNLKLEAMVGKQSLEAINQVIAVMDVLSGGENARKTGSEANS